MKRKKIEDIQKLMQPAPKFVAKFGYRPQGFQIGQTNPVAWVGQAVFTTLHPNIIATNRDALMKTIAFVARGKFELYEKEKIEFTND